MADRLTNARRSTAAPWQQWMGSQRSGSATSLLGPDEENLERARSRVRSQGDLAEALSLPGSTDGAPPQGALSSALDFLDRPKSAVVGALSPGEAGDSPLHRFARGLSGRERFSFSDMPGLALDADAGPFDVANLTRRTVGFVGDVAADPLTYASFGGSVVGKKLAAEVVDNTLRQQASRHLGQQGLARWTQRAPGIAAPREAARRAPDATAREAAEGRLAAALDLPDERLADIGAREFSGAAAGSYVEGGSIGLRRFLKRELGDDAGETAFSALPRDVQGGLRVRAPFWRDPITRGPASVGVGGGGRILEHIGLDDAAVRLHGWRNQRRAQGVGRQIADKMSGKDGEAYGEMVEALITSNAESPIRASYASYAALRDLRRQAERLGMTIHRSTQDAIAPSELLLRTAPDEQAARTAYQRWFERPAEVEEFLSGATRVDAGWEAPGIAAIADQNERIGVMAAMNAHDFIRQQPEQLRQLGVSIGDINEYVPRILSDSEREIRAAGRPVRASKGQRGGALAYNPTTARDRYMNARLVEDADGAVRVEFGWQATSDINEQAGRMVFTADPTSVTAAYGDAIRQLATRAKFAQLLQDSRVVAQGGSEYQRILGGRAVRTIGERLNLEGVEHGAYLQDALRRAGVEAERAARAADSAESRMYAKVAADGAQAAESRFGAGRGALRRQVAAEQKLADLEAEIDRLALDREALSAQIVQVVNDTDVDLQFANLGTLMDGLTDFYARHSARLASDLEGVTGEGRKVIEQAVRSVRARLESSRRAADAARTGKATLDPTTQAYRDGGLEALGKMRRDMPALHLPAELDQTYAAPMVRRMAEAYYQAQGPDSSELKTLIDSIYRPYFAWFKATATIGRGPGYHARNTIGGIWNNMLYGVTGADHQLSLTLNRARRDAWSQAVDETSARIARDTGMDVAEARNNLPRDLVARRADELVEAATAGTNVADGVTLYDIHRMGLHEEIGWGTDSSRLGEALGGTIRRQDDPTRAVYWQADPRQFDQTRERVQLFRGVDNERELNAVQRAANRSVDWWWMDQSKQWAALSEDFIRYAAFVRGVRQYGAADGGRTAALLGRALHFDYGDLSPFEDKWMRGTLIPFYVWSRNNVPLQVRALLKDPGKMHKVGMTQEALEDIWGDDELDVVPEWMQERFGFVSRFGANADGDRLLIGLETPAYDLNQWLKVGRPGEAATSMLRNVGSNVSPVFKLPVEVLMGTDAFTGARLDEGGALAPGWAGVVPGLTFEDSRGEDRWSHWANKAYRDIAPWLSQAARLDPTGVLSDPNLQRRQGTSWAATLAAAPLATQTPRQEAGEVMQRASRLQRRIGKTDQPLVDRARALLEAGYTPEMVRVLLQ